MKDVLRQAYEYAQYSTCKDKKVGCVLLNAEKKVIALGYNRIPQDEPCDMCLTPSKQVFCPAVHAEMAALIFLASIKNRYPYIAVCTLEPCIECTKALILAGVKEIYYDRPTNPRKSGKHIFQSFISDEVGRWDLIPGFNWNYTELPSNNGSTT